MEPLVFTDSLKFGVAVIDKQHRRMVKIVNELLRAVLDHPLGESEDQLLDELVRLPTRSAVICPWKRLPSVVAGCAQDAIC